MKKLARKISNDLETFQEAYVYNSELARLWPVTMPPEERHRRIQKFAKEHGFNVNVYEIGMCAIFRKPARKRSPRRTKRGD